jgi:hypothetical protein
MRITLSSWRRQTSTDSTTARVSRAATSCTSGFVVHFFDRTLIERLSDGFVLVDVSEFTEGELPRRLARVTMRRA